MSAQTILRIFYLGEPDMGEPYLSGIRDDAAPCGLQKADLSLTGALS